MIRIIELDVLDLFNFHYGICVKNRIVEKGWHVMFGNNNWWYRKGACDVFKTHASTQCGQITLALGPGSNAPTVAIDRTYISRLIGLPVNIAYNLVEHSQMKDVDILAVDEKGHQYWLDAIAPYKDDTTHIDYEQKALKSKRLQENVMLVAKWFS